MTDRRDFLKHTVLSTTGLIILPLLSFAEKNAIGAADELEQNFSSPASAFRPMAYWMWMNGNVTKNGIRLDLEAMKEMGLSGAFIYNTGLGVPKGPVDYGTKAWEEMVVYAVTEAKQLGLELFLHNAPGYSSTGGPTVTPQMGMQQLVWTETTIEGGHSINVQLPQPLIKLGHYRDVAVVAFPSNGTEMQKMQDQFFRMKVNGKEISKTSVNQQATEVKISLQRPGKNEDGLLFEFGEPFEARAIAVKRIAEPSTYVYDAAYDHPPTLLLQSSADGREYRDVCTISMPFLRSMEAPGVQSFPAVKAKYFRLLTNRETMLTGVELFSDPRLKGWAGKANFTDNEKENNEAIEDRFIIDQDTVFDLTHKLQEDGSLTWEAPAGNWTILRFGHTCTGTKNVAAPIGADGLEIDKFSKESVDAYFKLSLDNLLDQLKPFAAKAFKGLLIDSYEIGKQNWTEFFPAEFVQNRGYDLTRWLPALTGRVVKNVVSTEKFLWDFRRTQADLVAENYYGHFRKKCADQGLLFYTQPYGDGVFDGLQVGRYADASLGEFWTRYTPGTINQCKQAVSIAHGYGKKMVAAEAFTGMPLTARWTEYPYALKSQGDYMYCLGLNQFVFHVFVHQPYTTGFPGMTMGPYGTHFDRNNTWCKGAKNWITYLTRTQYLLQQGLPVADIVYFKGEDPVSGIPDVHYVDPPVPRSLAGDVIGPDVLSRIKMADNKILLPDGMQYRLMILAPLARLSLPVLQRLQTLVEQGMHLVVTTKPVDTPGLQNSAAVLQKRVEEWWGDLDGETVKEKEIGQGTVYWNTPFSAILEALNIKPDFQFTASDTDAAIHCTHRKLADADLYFISNQLRRSEVLVCHFRVGNKQPEIWNAETGETSMAALYSFEEGGVKIPLHMEPAGSLFVIFRKSAKSPSYHTVLRNGLSILSTKSNSLIEANPCQNIVNDFTIFCWVKPDTTADHPKGVLIFPPEGELVYGPGHAACGLAAGQNGIRVFEREQGPNHQARVLISSTQRLEGWTHLALRYNAGKPFLFVNGQLAGSNEASRRIIHPGLGAPPTDEAFSAYFEGSFTQPQLVAEALSDEAIKKQFQQGLPLPELPFPICLDRLGKGELRATVWQNGDYQIKGRNADHALHIAECKTVPISSSWQVFFPPNSGAPASIHLDDLFSLHKHPDFGVKHFSGTAVYQTSFHFAEKRPSSHQRILLDLGRVEVLAEVELNGKKLGTLWKEPFRIEVTDLLREGLNTLRVSVTNLWPNRLIGDAHLPVENEYNSNGFITKMPDWYTYNKQKPGERITFTCWDSFKKEDPLLESGLLGPVRLLFGVEKVFSGSSVNK